MNKHDGYKPVVCTYDNPATMARECWQDGQLICHYTMEALMRKPNNWERQPIPREYLFFGANIGDWATGQCVGDLAAMNTKCTETDLQASPSEVK